MFGIKAEINISHKSNSLLINNLHAYQNAKRLDSDSISIINLNFQILKELIKYSNKEYHLIVLFVDWCKPSRERIPMIDSVTSGFQNLFVYYVYPDREKNLKFLKRYLRNQSIIRKAYVLDNTYKGNVARRFIAFRNQICADCENYLGFPTVILMDKSMKVLFKATGGDIEGLKDFLIEFNAHNKN